MSSDLEFILLLMSKFKGKPIPDLWELFAYAIDSPETTPTIPMKEKTSCRIVVPISGGLDSTIAHSMAQRNNPEIKITAVYFDFGQEYKTKEINALRNLGIDFHVEVLGDFQAFKHIIPARNLAILLRSAEIAGAGGEVHFGSVMGEMPPMGGDKSLRFITAMSRYLLNYYSVRLRTMSADTKAGWIRSVLPSITLDYLLKTVSCFSETAIHCGKCQACLRHYIAFAYNGYGEEVLKTYALHPLKGATAAIDKYRRMMLPIIKGTSSHHYGKKRSEETLSIIGIE